MMGFLGVQVDGPLRYQVVLWQRGMVGGDGGDGDGGDGGDGGFGVPGVWEWVRWFLVQVVGRGGQWEGM